MSYFRAFDIMLLRHLSSSLRFALALIWSACVLAFLGCAPGEATRNARSTGGSQPGNELLKQPTPVSPPGTLRERIEAAVDQVRQRELRTDHSFWTIFHGILGLGPSLTLRDPASRSPVNALEYICNGHPIRGLEFVPTAHGLDVRTAAQMFLGQGHQDQFVGEMAQWGVPIDTPLTVNGRKFTFRDFVQHTQMRARVTTNQELSWAIVVLGHYLGTDIAWTNEHGERLTFEDLVHYELRQPIETAACGGTHRLFGLTWVHHLHLQKGGKTEGPWKELDDRMRTYQRRAREMQNSDGSFSTNFFRERGQAADTELRLNTTGHIFEWLALLLGDDELRSPWMQEAANRLALMILEVQNSPMESGSLYHAAHGLLIYYSRLYDAQKLGRHQPLVPVAPR
jgi:hypothetical protein